MDINDNLRRLAELKGSDLFLSVGAPPTAKCEGAYVRLDSEPLAKGAVKLMAYELMSERQAEEFERDLEMNLAVGIAGVGRFRANVYLQRGEVCQRRLKTDPLFRNIVGLKLTHPLRLSVG